MNKKYLNEFVCLVLNHPDNPYEDKYQFYIELWEYAKLSVMNQLLTDRSRFLNRQYLGYARTIPEQDMMYKYDTFDEFLDDLKLDQHEKEYIKLRLI